MNKNVIGLDLGGTSIKYGLGNTINHLTHFNVRKHYSSSIDDIKSLLNITVSELLNIESQVNCICIASPGVIDCEKGIVLGSTPNLPYLKGINLKKLLEDLFSLPVFIDNDANLMTLAESSNYPNKSTLGITIGTGIGTGFVDDNGIFHGNTWKGLEAGHIIVVPNGRDCLCGKKGCLEAYASANSMIRIINEYFPETNNYNINDILMLSRENENYYSKLKEIYNVFAIALANLTMILNCDTIVLGGGVIEIEYYHFELIKKLTLSYLTHEYHDVKITKAQYGNKAGVMGAIMLGLDKLDIK